MATKILVLHCKDDVLYFDVSTPEKRRAAMRFIFDMNQGRYAYESDPEVRHWIERGKNGYDAMAAQVVELRNALDCEYETYDIVSLIDATQEKYNA